METLADRPDDDDGNCDDEASEDELSQCERVFGHPGLAGRWVQVTKQ